MSPSQFRKFAWIVLIYALLVMVWGAAVRATGSGAGCGAHWPLCNGEVIPLAPTLKTIVEFAHRSTSGLILLMTAMLVWMSAKTFPAGHQARTAAKWSLIFVIVEAIIGAGIVLLRLVENDASAMRAIYIAGHLANTLILIGCYAWTVVAAAPSAVSWTPDKSAKVARWLTISLAGLIVVGAAGAIVALGDTLFPATSLAEGFAADLDPTAHFLIRLRVWHPAIAVVVCAVLLTTIVRSDAMDEPAVRTPARAVLWLVIAQVALGASNILLLAPLPLQLLHLLVSYLLWMSVVWVWLVTRSARDLPAS